MQNIYGKKKETLYYLPFEISELKKVIGYGLEVTDGPLRTPWTNRTIQTIQKYKPLSPLSP